MRRTFILGFITLFLGCIPIDTNPRPEPEPALCDVNVTDGLRMRMRAVSPPRIFPAPRIVGGRPARPGEYPAAVAFVSAGGFQFCGGAYAGDGWVRTAAHCDIEPGDVAVIGRIDLRGSDGDEFQILRVLTHGGYDPATSQNDIALVQLSGDTSHLEAIPPTTTFIEEGARADVIGWGLLEENGEQSPLLMTVSVPVTSHDACDAAYGGIVRSMICAGEPTGGKDSCQGDSGGPLIVLEEGTAKPLHAGVVSFGHGCARAGFFGVYSRVSEFVAWEEACRVAYGG